MFFQIYLIPGMLEVKEILFKDLPNVLVHVNQTEQY